MWTCIQYVLRSEHITVSTVDISTMNGNNDAKEGDAEENKPPTPKQPIGNLSVTKHGLKKFKRIKKFACKLCNTVTNSRREINDHHKTSHKKCYCETCGKACNTPSTLKRDMYSHCDSLPFLCTDCDAKFAFTGQLKQHRFKHCKVAAFTCSKCPNHYMREGKLVKHVKTHDNINYKCSKCKYTTLDPWNLKQHQRIHSDELPCMCLQCYKQFCFWMQKQQHKCEPPVDSTDTGSD